MFRPKDTKERILHRFKIANGHLKKVMQMLEDDVYCMDVIHQSQAVQKALKEADALTLENHLNSCVVNNIRKGETKASIDEIMKVFRK